jgi:hypothetical protein
MVLKTKPPLKFFFWLCVSVLFTSYLLVEGMSIVGALIYGLGMVLLYWMISTTDCCVILKDDSIEIIFNKTFWKRRVIKINDSNSIELKKADPFWKLMFMNNSIERYYCSQDKLVIVSVDSTEEIMINTNSSDLKLLIDSFQKTKQKKAAHY